MMDIFQLFSIKCKNFKPFGANAAGFDRIKLFNILIGRNNSGKSSLLDLIDYFRTTRYIQKMGHKGNLLSVEISVMYSSEVQKFLTEDEGIVTLQHKGGILNGFNDRITWILNQNGSFTYNVDQKHVNRFAHNENILQSIINHYKDQFGKFHFARLGADRNIRPETDASPQEPPKGILLSPDGDGATKILNRMINNDNFANRRIIEQAFLEDFNKIYEPDGVFSRILVLRREEPQTPGIKNVNENQMFEINLEYSDGTTVPMSQMGSGVKTIFLVLMMIHVVPKILIGKPLSEFMFGLEELENNLHPAIQKRLFLYLRKIANQEKCKFLSRRIHMLL